MSAPSSTSDEPSSTKPIITATRLSEAALLSTPPPFVPYRHSSTAAAAVTGQRGDRSTSPSFRQRSPQPSSFHSSNNNNSSVGKSRGQDKGAEQQQRRESQRTKQLSYGYNTDGFRNMTALLQRYPQLRAGGVLPLLPPAIQNNRSTTTTTSPRNNHSSSGNEAVCACGAPALSKRSWDVLVRRWRRGLHFFDDIYLSDDDNEMDHGQTSAAGNNNKTKTTVQFEKWLKRAIGIRLIALRQRLRWVTAAHADSATKASEMEERLLSERAPVLLRTLVAPVWGTAAPPKAIDKTATGNRHSAAKDNTNNDEEAAVLRYAIDKASSMLTQLIQSGPRAKVDPERTSAATAASIMQARRNVPTSQLKLPLEPSLRCMLRDPDTMFVDLESVVPSNASALTRGRSSKAMDANAEQENNEAAEGEDASSAPAAVSGGKSTEPRSGVKGPTRRHGTGVCPADAGIKVLVAPSHEAQLYDVYSMSPISSTGTTSSPKHDGGKSRSAAHSDPCAATPTCSSEETLNSPNTKVPAEPTQQMRMMTVTPVLLQQLTSQGRAAATTASSSSVPRAAPAAMVNPYSPSPPPAAGSTQPQRNKHQQAAAAAAATSFVPPHQQQHYYPPAHHLLSSFPMMMANAPFNPSTVPPPALPTMFNNASSFIHPASPHQFNKRAASPTSSFTAPRGVIQTTAKSFQPASESKQVLLPLPTGGAPPSTSKPSSNGGATAAAALNPLAVPFEPFKGRDQVNVQLLGELDAVALS